MQTIHTLPRLALCLAALGGSHAALAERWAIGAGALYEQLPYRDYRQVVTPVPLLNYEGEQLFLRDSAVAGLFLLKSPADRLTLNLYYSPLHFRPSKSGDAALKRLDKRRATAMAGIGYRHDADWGALRAEAAADVLGNSNGVAIDAAYQYPLRLGRLYIAPGAGVTWHSRRHNDYYFGVSQRESLRSGLPAYRPDSGATPYASLTLSYAFSDSWQAFVLGRYTRLDNGARDSPMTARNGTVLIGGGIVYQFN